MSRQIRVGPLALAAALALAGGVIAVAPAQAAQGSGNPALLATPASALSPTSPTTVQVRGTDFLVPPHTAGTSVSGGVYVFFGWVDAAKKWGPSARNITNTDGNFGTTYLYPGQAGGPDSTTDDSGSIGYVAFTNVPETPGGEAPEFAMDDKGDWTMPLKVPGATFTTEFPGAAGSKTTDCLKVTCGIFTIGAHGKASATNEKFTPLKFVGGTGSTATPTPKPGPTPKPTTSANTNSDNDPDAPGDNDGSGSGTDPLPKTGIDDGSSSVSVVRPLTPLDGQTVAVGVTGVTGSGTGGGLALFGVAALVALVMALTVSLFLRYRREDTR